VLAGSIEPLWALSGAEPPRWASTAAPIRRQRVIARELIDSVARFNRRWTHFIDHLNLAPTNHIIEEYNRYYLLEKECVMGSPRLAGRHFTPARMVTTEMLRSDYPSLPVPELLDPSRGGDRGSSAV
jgi:hypothetical protein